MGALHAGHLALIKQSKAISDLTVCSIFVNPTQFNDPADLEKYPKPIENDRQLLQSEGCDVLFMPQVDEMYGPNENWHIDLGHLDKLWEGEKRPGHYQGVTQIVYKLFQLVRPDWAFFGQKDFQQCMVIQYMVDHLRLPIQIKVVDTIRDPDGLALSSRNARLSPTGRRQALALSKALFTVKLGFEEGESFTQLKEKALDFLHQAAGITLEYFAICHTADLTEVKEEDDRKSPLVAILAAWVEGVRLIDNIRLNN